MKKILSLMLVLVILILSVGCSSSVKNTDKVNKHEDFTLNLLVVNFDEENKTIEAAEIENPEEISYVISFDQEIKAKAGDQIAVVADVIMESYPAQVKAKSIAVTSQAQEPSTCIEAEPVSFEILDKMNLPEGLNVDENHKESGYDFVEKEEANYLIVYMGERNTGGYSIIISDILKVGDEYLVLVDQQSPAHDDMVTMAFTYPYSLVKLDKEITEDKIKIERTNH